MISYVKLVSNAYYWLTKHTQTRRNKAQTLVFIFQVACFDHVLGTGEFLRISVSDNVLPSYIGPNQVHFIVSTVHGSQIHCI